MSVFQSDDNYLGVRPVYVSAVLGRKFSHASSALLGVSTEICVGGAVNSIHACMALGGRV